jgi:hypothetical protein
MLAQVLIAEADSFVALWKDLKLPDGRDRVVRDGHGPHRAIQTGVVKLTDEPTETTAWLGRRDSNLCISKSDLLNFIPPQRDLGVDRARL